MLKTGQTSALLRSLPSYEKAFIKKQRCTAMVITLRAQAGISDNVESLQGSSVVADRVKFEHQLLRMASSLLDLQKICFEPK